jgi:AGZA family xanthine/uracil permease-like MFS transporter
MSMSTMAATFRESFLERQFRFAEHGTTLSRDTMAGATTFIVMSYIIFLNPIILTTVKPKTGAALPFDGVVTATCVVAAVMTILMGLYTNRAYALAPGLGINAIVAFQLVGAEGLSYPSAMGLILLEGAAVTLLVLTGLRQAIMTAIPLELKKAIAIGIGLFIAFIGLYNAQIVVQGDGVPVTLARFTTWPILIAFIGILLTIVLRARSFRGDLLVGIIGTTIIATIINHATDFKALRPNTAHWPGIHNIASGGNWSLFGNFDFHAFAKLGVISALVWVFALFLSDFFDTMGTLVGVGKPAGYLDEKGELPGIRKPLLVDSLAAVAGGASSTSSATTYIESGSGVASGGRTGWVAVVAGALFVPFIFFTPLIGMVPPGDCGGAPDRRLLDDQHPHRRRRRGRRPHGPGEARRHRLPRPSDRPAVRARDHVDAVQLLDHERDRLRVHRVCRDPRCARSVAARAPAHVGRRRRIRPVLPGPALAGPRELDLDKKEEGVIAGATVRATSSSCR